MKVVIFKIYGILILISVIYFLIFQLGEKKEDNLLDTTMSLPFLPFVAIRECYKRRCIIFQYSLKYLSFIFDIIYNISIWVVIKINYLIDWFIRIMFWIFNIIEPIFVIIEVFLKFLGEKF